MKGRKPKPTALRLIEGNREHRTIHQELEPQPKSEQPPRPKILNKEAKKHWNYLLRELAGMNTVASSDQGTVMAAAISYGLLHDIDSEIKVLSGVQDAEKRLMELRRLLNNTLANLVRFEADLGLNPTARTRIRLDKPSQKTRKEKLLG